MSRAIFTANRFHLGDNLIFLNLLRALAKAHVSRAFVHFCNGSDIPQLREVVADLPNILLEPFESPLWVAHERDAVNVWKNAESHWERSQNRWDWAAHALEHHAWTARRMGFESPFTCREQLLFDYPALGQTIEEPARDFLVIDAEPCSGQLKPMARHGSGYLDQFIALLKNAGHNVRTTSACKKEGYTISQIGALSLKCRHVVGVMSGPAWPCLNTTRHHLHLTEGRRTIFLLDNGEQLRLPGVEQCESSEGLMVIAESEGWI